jgi:hypothetical protein
MSTKYRDISAKYQEGWLSELDSRTTIAKEVRERYQALTDERSIWLEYWLSSQERELAEGKQFDVGKWVQAANGLQGIYAKLGLSRVSKDATSLATFLKNRCANDS